MTKQCTSFKCVLRSNFVALLLTFLYLTTLLVTMIVMRDAKLVTSLSWIQGMTGGWAIAVTTALKISPGHDSHDPTELSSQKTTQTTETTTETSPPAPPASAA